MIEFAALPMLVSLIAAAIPYLLLRNRVRSRQTIYWSANRLLEEAVKSQARKMDWLRWLLLALRTLALVALAIAVANPIWLSSISATPAPASGSALYCYVVDCSASMSLKTQDEANAPTRLDEVTTSIRNELSALSDYDMVAIVAAGKLSEVRFMGDRSDIASIERALAGITARPTSVDCDAIVATVQQVFDQAAVRSDAIRHAIIKIHSDFSEHDWSQEKLLDLQKRLATAVNDLPTQVNFEETELDVVSSKSIRNLTICNLEYKVIEEDETSGRLVVQIKNTGSKANNPTTVQLWIDNHLENSSEIGTLSASQSGLVEFALARHAELDQIVEVRLPEDQLLLDNVGYFVLEHALPQSALLVGDDIGATVGLQSAYQSYGVDVQHYVALEDIGIKDTPQDVHLVDPSAINETLLTRIVGLANQDKDVFVWLGSALPASMLNEISNSESIPSQEFSMADWDTNDLATILAPADNQLGSSPVSFSMPLSKYWRAISLRDGWQAVLALETGDPFAIRKSIGRGSVNWIVTPPTLATEDSNLQLWNAMARWPSFIPLVDYLRRSANQSMRRNYLVGETVILNSSDRTDSSIERPNGTITIESSLNRSEIRFVADHLGWYKILSKENVSVPSVTVGVNFDCNEINFTASQVPQAFQMGEASAIKGVIAATAKQSLFRMLLMFSIVFLVSETIVTAIAASR